MPRAQRTTRRARELAEAVLIAVILALFARTFLVQAFVVPSASMEETVLPGDHLLVNKFLYAPHADWPIRWLPYREVRRGDVIVFKFPQDPSHDYIKRAVAISGDTVEIRAGTVYVGGVAETRSVTHSSPTQPTRRDWLDPLRVPPRSTFAMGDNRDGSYDSRFWGPLPAENLKGRALLIYWSWNPESGGSANPIRRFAGFFRDTRWSRTFHTVK